MRKISLKHGIALMATWRSGVALICVGVFLAGTSLLLMDQTDHRVPLLTRIQQADTVFAEWVSTGISPPVATSADFAESSPMGELARALEGSSPAELDQLEKAGGSGVLVSAYRAVTEPTAFNYKARAAVPTRYLMVVASGFIMAGLAILVTTFRRAP